jgi:hypothetical protein
LHERDLTSADARDARARRDGLNCLGILLNNIVDINAADRASHSYMSLSRFGIMGIFD